MVWGIFWILNIIYLLKLLFFDIDIGLFVLFFLGVMYSFVILKFKFLKFILIVFEKVFFNVLDGVIILDFENNIVNFNNVLKNIILGLKYI